MACSFLQLFWNILLLLLIERILFIKHLCNEVFKKKLKKKKAKVKNCIKAILNIKLCSISFGNCGLTKAHKWFSRAETQREELLRNTPSFLVSELRILLLLLWPECSFSLQTDWLLCFPSSLPYSSFNEICLAWISLLAN